MIKCALSLLIIATCIMGMFADEFYEKQKKLDSECAKYCYQVAKPLLLMAPVCHNKDADIKELNSKIANLQNKLSVYEERERKSLEEGTKCNELNDKFIKLHEKLAVYEYREKGFEEGNIELKTKIANLQNDLSFYKERERKSLEEGNMCNELNATLAELPRIFLNLQDREKKGIEEVNSNEKLNVQLGEVQEKLGDCEEREKKDIEEINLNKKVNVQLGEVQEKLGDCEERENKCIKEINLNKKVNVQLGEVQEKLANCEEREKKIKEKNSKAESKSKASLEEYRVKISELESSYLALIISNQKLKEDLGKFNNYPKYNNTCLKSFRGADTTGIVEIEGMEAFPVRCVNDLNSGPGWMLIQKRTEERTVNDRSLYSSWSEYRDGFGDINDVFFIGLEKLHRLTNAVPHELYIDMEDFYGYKKFAHYDNFRVGNESEQYPLKDLGNYTPNSNAGDALRYNNNMKFSTPDRDNDNSPDVDCAYEYLSGWWHNDCTKANLNGWQYGRYEYYIDGIWHYVKLKNVRMLIRPKVKK